MYATIPKKTHNRLKIQQSLSKARSPDDERVKPFVYVVALVSAISGLVFGFDIGGSGGTFVMDGFREHFHWPPHVEGGTDPTYVANQQGWITGCFAIGCVFGSMPSGYLVDRFGRTVSIMGLTFVFTVGAVIQLVPVNIEMLYAGRVISGIGCGGLSMAATLYQSEIAPSCVRGLIVSIQQLAVTFGIFLAGLFNVGLQHWEEGWRLSYGGKSFFSTILFIAMFFMPESPRWLVGQDRNDEAIASLKRIRFEDQVDNEFHDIVEAVEEERSQKAKSDGQSGGYMDLFSTKELMWYRTMVGFGVQLLQQFTGINAVMYFARVIFAKFLTTQGAIAANMAVCLVNFFATFLALYLVDRAGRRILLVSGGLGMALFTGLFAIFTSSLFDYTTNRGIGIALIVFTAIYVLNFAYSWGPLGWVVAAEVFPQHLRGKGMGITTLANWLSNFLIARTLPLMILPTSLNLWGTFALLSGFCIFMSIFVMSCLPETKGVDLELVEWIFRVFLREPLWKRMKLSTKGVDEDTLNAVLGLDGKTSGLGKIDEVEKDKEKGLELSHVRPSMLFGKEDASFDEAKANTQV